MENENAIVVRDQLRRLLPSQSPDPAPSPPPHSDVIPARIGELLSQIMVSPEDLIGELAILFAENPDPTSLTWWPKVEGVLVTLAPQYLLQLSEQALELRRQLVLFNSANEASTDTRSPKPFSAPTASPGPEVQSL